MRRFKPTVKKSNTGPVIFRAWALYKPGNRLVGEFISSYETTYRGNKSPNFRIKVLEANFKVEKDDKKISPVGEVIILNSAGQLNKFMTEVKPGMLIEVEYDGKKPGKDDVEYHTFSVLEAGYPEDVVEVETEGEDVVEEEAGEEEDGL